MYFKNATKQCRENEHNLYGKHTLIELISNLIMKRHFH